MNGYEQAVYFIYSLSFLLIRALAVSLIASKVHTASRTPAEYLYEVPSSAYGNEVDEVRLILMILALCVSYFLHFLESNFGVSGTKISKSSSW